MKIKFLIILLMIVCCRYNMFGQKNEPVWMELDSLINNGLIESGRELNSKIIKDAEIGNKYPELIKAIIYDLRMTEQKEEESVIKNIAKLNEWINKLGQQKSLTTNKNDERIGAISILHLLVAEHYLQYYNRNRYKLYNRSITEKYKYEDIRSWDAKRFLKEIKSEMDLSLRNTDELKRIDIKTFNLILEKGVDWKGNNTEIYRPSLFDFIAYRIIEIANTDRIFVSEPIFREQIESAEFFKPSKEFVNITISKADTFNLKLYALRIFQELEKFHLPDKDKLALIDAITNRMEFVMLNSVDENKDSLYLKALLDIKEEFKNQKGEADILYKIAETYEKRGNSYHYGYNEKNKWDLKKAMEYCDETIKKYPSSGAAEKCKVIIKRINKNSLEIKIESENLIKKPFRALLTYKTSNKVFLRLIKRTDILEDENLQRKFYGKELIIEYLKKEKYREWSQQLAIDGDYQKHSTEIKIDALENGYYVLLVSDVDFKDYINDTNTTAVYVKFQVTNILYTSREKKGGGLELKIYDRETGKPLNRVEAELYIRTYSYEKNEYQIKYNKRLFSDKDGKIILEEDKNNYGALFIKFIYRGDVCISNDFFVPVKYSPENKMYTKTYFFTDRALYRPGQTIYFKGIVVETDGSNTKLSAGRRSTVVLYDVNQKTVSKLDLTSDEWGSISGSFIAPEGVLKGQMNINNKTGSVYFSVEEYKLPKFEVKFDTIASSYKLGDKVVLKANATAYSGFGLDEAKVKFRVVRKTYYPYKNYYYYFPEIYLKPETEIKNGEIVVKNGKFEIEFELKPDKSIPERFEPNFRFMVYADVTDINSETHSANTSLYAGYKSLIIESNITDNIDKEKVFIYKPEIKNLAGKIVDVKDSLKIFRLKQPERILRKRYWDKPDKFVISKEEYLQLFPNDIYNDEDSPEKWQKLEMKAAFYDNKNKEIDFKNWEEGTYVAEISVMDNTGTKTVKKGYFTLYSSANSKMADNTMLFTVFNNEKKYEPGQKAEIIVGSVAKDAHILYEIELNGKIIHKEWLKLNDSKKKLIIDIKEEYRGNIAVHFLMVKNNRTYISDMLIEVPFSNKELAIEFEKFRNKLEPGMEEEWKVIIKNKSGQTEIAKMLATMYDASLDVYRKHQWNMNLYNENQTNMIWNINRENVEVASNYPDFYYSGAQEKSYDRLNMFGYNFIFPSYFTLSEKSNSGFSTKDAKRQYKISSVTDESIATGLHGLEEKEDISETEEIVEPEIKIRKNFNETAFFYPSLMTNDKGEIVVKFKLPDALTRWNFKGLAYTKDLKYAFEEKIITASKNLMLITNVPRFVRQGDSLIFSAKLTNISEKQLNVKSLLKLSNYDLTGKITELPIVADRVNEISAGGNILLSWSIKIPDDSKGIFYHIQSKANDYNDAEEGIIPVLPDKIAVTESYNVWVRKGESRKFRFDKMYKSLENKNSTLENYKVTFEYSSNPVWYVVQALTYLEEVAYESSFDIYQKFYANSIAKYITDKNPEIKKVFELWKTYNKDAFLSNLEKNPELKNIMLQEMPWVAEADDEKERKRKIGLLFDVNKMNNELNSSLNKLIKMQTLNGGWPWFEGMPESNYFTLLISSGLAKLNKIGAFEDKVIQKDIDLVIKKAVVFIDKEIKVAYDNIIKTSKDPNARHINSLQVYYLYVRSYFNNIMMNEESLEAFNYFKKQAIKYCFEFNLYNQAMIGIAAHRFNEAKTSSLILKSLQEKALHSQESGMYWKNNVAGYYWYQAPVETQAMIIEFFSTVEKNQQILSDIEEMKVWLIKQKQTTDWKTGRATTEACLALLGENSNLLLNSQTPEITIGKEKIEANQTDAGTGYFKIIKNKEEIKKETAEVEIKNPATIAWGGLYWQYFEKIDKIESQTGPLSLKKKLFIEKNTSAGKIIEPVTEKNPIKTGDRIKVVLELNTDRDMEYLHLKDLRAGGLEPEIVLSSYKYSGGLWYYQSMSDASASFFISYMPKGSYLFEYSLVATQKGEFSNGPASIQCLYAPEFSSHSEGMRISIK